MQRLPLLALFASVVLCSGQLANAFNVISPGDPILAIDLDFSTGSDSPGAEGVENILDGDSNTKYLNFGLGNTGFIATLPSPAAVQSFVLTTANDAPERDPASWSLFGTNETITTDDHGTGREQNWTLLDMGDLTLPDERFSVGNPVDVSNTTTYSSYKMTYPTVKNADTIMQVADVSFFNAAAGGGTNVLMGTTPENLIPIRDVVPAPSSNSPAGEAASFAIDRNNETKYLNFGEERSGIIVTPAVGPTVINGIQLTTANDAEARDPTSYEVYGTNDPITTPNNGIGNEDNWTLISSGATNLPVDRFTAGDVIPFSSPAAFTSYRVIFPTVRDAGAANSMQIAEIALLAPDQGTLEINRQTGVATLEAIENLTFESYEIRSPNSNGLDESNWSSISSTNADNEPWVETSATGASLAEEDGAGGANDGFTLAAGNTYNLGSIWQVVPTAFEDVSASFTRLDGAPLGISTSFVGTEIPIGDYSGNGSVGPEDWPAFQAVYGSSSAGMGALEAYLNGDLDGDFDSDLNDFNLFVEAAGGAAALFGSSSVPEPSSVVLLAGVVLAGFGISRVRKGRQAIAAVAVVSVVAASHATAQTYTNVGGVPSVISIPADQMNETEASGPENFFDDDFIDDPGAINGELFNTDYTVAETILGEPFLQYAGLNRDPKTVFLDYGSSVTANAFAYAQRSGADATADRVGTFEFWFSNSSFNDTVPTTEPDSVLKILPSDARLRDSVLRPYSLSGSHSGRYVAMRLTTSELSASQPVNNIGGHEFRLLQGPSDVVLEVNRATGALTLKNNLGGSTAIDIKSYNIDSPVGALDPSAFNGVRGDSGAFPAGTGSGNGWEIGGGSDPARLAEAFFNGESTLAAGTAGLALGNAYNELTLAEDLVFTYANAAGDTYGGRVTYVGAAPNVLPGDYTGDGTVDAEDYTAWRDALGTNQVLPNDATPGTVDEFDYRIWKANFGNSSNGSLVGTGSVPEPATWCLALAGIGAFVARRRLAK